MSIKTLLAACLYVIPMRTDGFQPPFVRHSLVKPLFQISDNGEKTILPEDEKAFNREVSNLDAGEKAFNIDGAETGDSFDIGDAIGLDGQISSSLDVQETFFNLGSDDDKDEVGPDSESAATVDVPNTDNVAVVDAPILTGTEDEKIPSETPPRCKKFVVVGGGWAGWGAAKALCESKIDAEIILLDALPDPTGSTPYLSKSGKPVEAGTRGFWKDYPNIYDLCDELGLDQNKVFTPYTNSSFYSPDGLEATAPVFSDTKVPEFRLPFLEDISIANLEIPMLPSPLGQVLATFPLFERIPLADRASMVGLLLATVDCLGGDEVVQAQYDRMTAHELFVRFGLSARLVEDFIKPTLLVGLFKPPEELSALVVMELLYYYALAHQDSFDVRWIKNGTVADSLIAPLAANLQQKYGLKVLGGCRVGRISLSPPQAGRVQKQQLVSDLEYTNRDGTKHVVPDIDGMVLALGCQGMTSVVNQSPELARYPAFSKAASMKGIDVISTRLWFDRKVSTRTPANVWSRFEELRGAGGTFFMLDQFQHDSLDELWGGETPQGSVVACDFYNAGALMSLSDDDLVDVLAKDLLPASVPAFADARVVDAWVGRFPGTVTWFAPGTFGRRPPLQGAGRDAVPNIKCAGDWVRMGDLEHGAKGLCQERAYVSGINAANVLLKDVEVANCSPRLHPVLPVRDDELQFKLAIAANRKVMNFLPRFWVR